MTSFILGVCAVTVAIGALGTLGPAQAAPTSTPAVVPIGPLPAIEAPAAAQVELGKKLFFDYRLSGDATMSCSTCHIPDKGWADGLALSLAYPGTRYFRNTKTLINAAHARYFYWDARLSGKDLPTQVRDSITETHFLNMDGRVMLERLKQIPEYVQGFQKAFGAEPSFGGTLKAIAAFEKTLVSHNVPFDQGAMSPAAERGRGLFEGKGGCIQCHYGPTFTDYQAHETGVPDHPDIVGDPLRHLTLRSFAKFMGVPNFENLRDDPGFFTVTKMPADYGTFVTPSLRELVHTAPYMHNGTLATLEGVVDFYDAGGGAGPGKDPLLQPLNLRAQDKTDLVAFLHALSGDPIAMAAPELPEYEVIPNWRQEPN